MSFKSFIALVSTFALLILFIFISHKNFAYAADFSCYYCPATFNCTSDGVQRTYNTPVTENVQSIINNADICGTRPVSTPGILCATSSSPVAYAWPRGQGCNSTTQTCDLNAGCIDRNSEPPSQCVYTSQFTTCANDSECPNVNNQCNGFHCIYQGYLLPDSNQTKYGTCQYAPDAQPNPAASSGGSLNFSSIPPPCGNNCGNKINTAFGEISTDAPGFVESILGLVLGIAGGILLLLLILAGYRLMTSQGDPEKIKAAREQVTSALIGLLFIIFSFVIYQFITSEVLNLPGFS